MEKLRNGDLRGASEVVAMPAFPNFVCDNDG